MDRSEAVKKRPAEGLVNVEGQTREWSSDG